MMKKIILSFLIVSLLMIGGMIVGCSKEETITGGAVIDVSTLTVLVKSDNGTLLDEASVFVNGFYKGKTTKYGSSPGTKTIVLSGTDNLIAVEKEGFITSKPTIVSASLAGEQQLIVVLKQKKTSLEVKVRGEGKLLREARVELENSKGYKQALLTDEKGTAHFERLDDDDYTVHAIKERFAPKEKNITIKYAKDGDEETFYLSLTKLPELIVEVNNGEGALSGAEVSFYTKKAYNTPGSWPIGTKITTEEGIVRFMSVQHSERYVVIVKQDGYEARKEEILLSPDNEKLQIEMVTDVD